MPLSLNTVSTIEALRFQVNAWKMQGLRTALVPTMGALHEGHLELVRKGVRLADRVVVTIFINPKQFSPNEDLATYPRDIQGDLDMLAQVGAHLVFVPDGDEVYPPGFTSKVLLEGPALAGLEDRFRPDFFGGVTTVVAKLFNMANCDYAMFGEKDYQQLMVVTQMARDLNIPTTVIPVETVRGPGGLALSSRNAYLNKQELELAPEMNRLLHVAANDIRNGIETELATQKAGKVLSTAGFKLDYLEARHANTLAKLKAPSDPIRLLAAGWLGKTRLLDNIPV
ncbi:Pantoate--beta-alanine ligase [hydrothermal vent metagenome]|uniref:pantoate--beta-alanine ligase (AMP-forming) n=1 Tax=hydrothermal vent metagenome TaxID=652676 RepID=A0A3B0R4D4_9ZZZZ